MAQTTNMQILSFLLQNTEILEYTDPQIQDTINALPPLNNWSPKDGPRRFIFDTDEGIICYVNPANPIFETQEYQEILTKEPILDFMGIQVFDTSL